MKLDCAMHQIKKLKESIARLEKLGACDLEMVAMSAVTGSYRETVNVSEELMREIVDETAKAHRAELAKLQSVIDLAEAALRGLDA